MKIALTGAMGLVGRYTSAELARAGHQVVALTHHPSQDCAFPQKVVDITDFPAVREAVRGCDAVIHLAAIPHPAGDKDSSVMHTNVIGDYNVVLAAGLLGIRRVAIASSDCALGIPWSHSKIDRVKYLPVDEEHPASPDNGYGLSKLLSERMCNAMSLRFPELSIASLRITHVLRPEAYRSAGFLDWTKDPDAGPENLWSYIDARDCAAAFRLAVENYRPGRHEVYYIAADNTRSRIPSRELIRRYYPGAELRGPFSGFESLESNRKARRLLGFVPLHRWDVPE